MDCEWLGLNKNSFYRVCEEEEWTATVSTRWGSKWRRHKNDADHWPSDPHAISEEGYKLDLYTGDVYDVKSRKRVGNVGKNLTAIRQQVRFVRRE